MTQVAYDPRAVLIDGKRTLLLSGAIHYPRSTPAMWPEMLRRSREAGLNTIETYAFWNLHERERGVFDFSDRLDLRHFCELAQQERLHVILRIGPYICAEINYGGFPAWLRDVPGIQMRTDNAPFKQEMERWVRLLTDYLRPLFAPNGGPIIMAQIENEYDLIARAYGDDGQRYLAWAIELGQRLELGVPWVMCVGGMPGAIETINGFYAHNQIERHHAAHPDQPSIWTEDWPGWYDTWGYPHHVRTPQNVAYGVARFIAAGGTGVNYYMWHGGTNFGREAMFLQTTSYDYTAPLDEWGLETTKSRHAARLHAVLLEHADALLQNERATPLALGPQQVAYIYSALAFVCNDDPSAAATLSFEGHTYTLPARSVILVAGGSVLFNTAEVAPNDTVERAMQPAADSALPFAWWPEPPPAQRADLPALKVAQPVEQLQLTHDTSDYCWYSTKLTITPEQAGAGTLTLRGAADMVHVFVDGALAASGPARFNENRSRIDGNTERLRTELTEHFGAGQFEQVKDSFTLEFALELPAGEHELALLCCALGLIKGDWQIGFQNMADERKGLWGTVEWRGTAVAGPWTLHAGLAGEHYALYGPAGELAAWQHDPSGGTGQPLRWWRASFARPNDNAPLALDLQGMNKGLAWLNGRCIGRYWLTPGVGELETWQQGTIELHGAGEPTQRYYHLPSAWLADMNTLVLFEELGGDPAVVQVCRWVEGNR